MGRHPTPPSREEAIPIAMHRVYAHEELRSRIELYRNTPHSSFSLPPTTHHWVICQHAAGPGQLLLQADGREYHAGGMNRQQVIYIPPGTRTQWEFSPADGSTHLLIPDKLFLAALPDIRSFSAIQGRGPLVGMDLPSISRLLTSCSKRLNENSPVSNINLAEMIVNSARVFAQELTSINEGQLRSQPSTQKLNAKTLQDIWDYMWDNIERNIKLSELARVAHLSPFHFSRVFKEATGIPPHQALLRIRIQKARTLIPKSGSLTHIAYCCGFSDQAHFTRTFKDQTGFTPSQFREKSS